MNKRFRPAALLLLGLAGCWLLLGSAAAEARDAGRAITGDFSEGFEDVSLLASRGWFTRNNSSPLGISGWFQGNPAVFPAHSGPQDAYIAANFDNVGNFGTISNWLLTPEMRLQNGTRIRFWTRSDQDPVQPFPDRLEVRLSTAGSSTNVGTTATSVGNFGTRLLVINEFLGTAYPRIWTEYEIVLSGLAQPTTGRIAFRYFVIDSGAQGDNGTYIGIDSFSVTQPPPSGGEEDVIFADRFE